jgi:hypothetical protein
VIDTLIIISIMLIIASIYGLLLPIFENICHRFFPNNKAIKIIYYTLNLIGAVIAFAIIYGSVRIILMVL